MNLPPTNGLCGASAVTKRSGFARRHMSTSVPNLIRSSRLTGMISMNESQQANSPSAIGISMPRSWHRFASKSSARLLQLRVIGREIGVDVGQPELDDPLARRRLQRATVVARQVCAERELIARRVMDGAELLAKRH